jgi:hypothetical protein
MQHCFIYYKIEAAAAGDLAPRLRAMLQDVATATGARTRLLRRADGSDGAVTLLEVYEGIAAPQVFAKALAAALRRADLPQSLLAQRRVEKFEDV